MTFRAKFIVDSVTQNSNGLKTARLFRANLSSQMPQGLVPIGAFEIGAADAAAAEQLAIGKEFYVDFIEVSGET